MSKVGISCLTGGELTEYHDDGQHPEPWMPTARRAEIAEHLAECDQCTADLAEIAEVAEFVRRALTLRYKLFSRKKGGEHDKATT